MKIHIGEFNAERYWADNTEIKLPSYSKESSACLINAMDELLCGFSEAHDVLITKYQFNKDLKEYLEDLGIQFMPFSEKEFKAKLDILDNKECKLEPYAITDFVMEASKIYPNLEKLPDIEIVKKVNSKRFSVCLSNLKGYNRHESYVVGSLMELEEAFKKLKNKMIVVKEPFGVSGKGSLFLKSTIHKNSILNYIRKKSQQREKVNFIVEEYLNKEIDFSTQLLISSIGDITILDTRMMKNENFSYKESYEMEVDVKKYLLRNGYFKIIKDIGENIYRQGYWGAACIDSMILSSKEIVPLVEINARKSMGLLHYFLQNRLQLKNSILMFFNLKIPIYLTAEKIIAAIDNGGILFGMKKEGIVPLSGNMLELEKTKDNSGYKKGRLYFLVTSKNKEKTIEKMFKILKELKISVC